MRYEPGKPWVPRDGKSFTSISTSYEPPHHAHRASQDWKLKVALGILVDEKAVKARATHLLLIPVRISSYLVSLPRTRSSLLSTKARFICGSRNQSRRQELAVYSWLCRLVIKSLPCGLQLINSETEKNYFPDIRTTERLVITERNITVDMTADQRAQGKYLAPLAWVVFNESQHSTRKSRSQSRRNLLSISSRIGTTRKQFLQFLYEAATSYSDSIARVRI